MNFVILRFDELKSTNTEALEQARRGADEGTCVVADKQTAGRGRQGRSWNSPAGAGIYFSLILRPRCESIYQPLITLAAAVAVHEMLVEVYAQTPDIKWPNDVLIGGKKICGILAEVTETEKGTAVILGIGINLRSDNFPPEIAATATSIQTEIGRPAEAETLLPALTAKLSFYYEMLQGENGPQFVVTEWGKRSSYYSGKDVRVITAQETLLGTTCGLETNGALRVKQPDGEIRAIQAGDVENLRPVL